MSEIKILVGADPEVFMFKDNAPVSAFDQIKGDKKNPFRVDYGAVQVDGMALEFNIDPASTEEEFVHNITKVMDQLASMVPGYELRPVPVAEFGSEYINSQPPAALELGCDPDFNAWENGRANPRPNGSLDFRTGAGHVHIGWTSGASAYDSDHIDTCVALTKQLDYYLGVPSLIYDTDNKRRLMYGAAGAFRTKPYGVEYRVLSNAWLRNVELMRWVYKNTKLGVERFLSGERAVDQWDNLAQRALSEPERYRNEAEFICNAMNIPMPPAV